MTLPTHYSSFELDVFHASQGPAASPDEAASPIAQHVATCSSCAAYLESLDELREPALARRPASVRALASVPAAPGRGAPVLRRFLAPAVTVAALAAAMLLYARSRSAEDDAHYVGVKGMPAVQIFVRSAGQTRVWDGRSTVRAGDSLAVHVACEQLAHVTVASPTPSGGFIRLSDGACPETPSTLPFTLVVDDQPGHERLAVVLSQSRLDDAALAGAVRASSREAGVWVTAFEFAKEKR